VYGGHNVVSTRVGVNRLPIGRPLRDPHRSVVHACVEMNRALRVVDEFLLAREIEGCGTTFSSFIETFMWADDEDEEDRVLVEDDVGGSTGAAPLEREFEGANAIQTAPQQMSSGRIGS
jgi:hypothetical protein